MTIKLIAITDQTKWDCQAEEIKKKAKTEQLALFVKSGSSDTRGFSREEVLE